MKIVQGNADRQPTGWLARWKKPSTRDVSGGGKGTRRVQWGSWYVQLPLFLLVFILGAVVYRSGVIRPLTVYLRTVLATGQIMTKVPEPVQEAAGSLEDEIRMYMNNGLPTLYIDMSFKNYQKLLDKRDEALKIGILNTTDADFVEGEIHLQDGPGLEADLRLKGDWVDHLEGDKWSFRIKLKNGEQILGMKQFNIHTPAARNFLNEWAFHQHLVQEGVLTTRYQFVNVLFNGKLLGIYAVEDHFTGEMIESQGRRQGLILRMNEDPMWDNLTVFWENQISQGSNLSVTNTWTAGIDPFQEGKLAEDPILSAEAETARDLLRSFQAGERPAAEVFDVELWGRFFALHDLWYARHGVAWHNLRFYYNPLTARIEPVSFDAAPFFRHKLLTTIVGDFLPLKIFNDPAVRTAYAKELFRLTQADTIAKVVDEYQPEHDRLRKALSVEYPLDEPNTETTVPVDWGILLERARSLHTELLPGALVHGRYQALNVQPGDSGEPSLGLDLVNMMMMPVEVLRVEIDGKAVLLSAGTGILPPVIDPQEQGVAATHIDVPLEGSEGLDSTEVPLVEVVARIAGLEQEYRATLSGGTLPAGMQTGPAPRQPTLAQALERYPFLESGPEGSDRLVVPAGVWDVQGDLVLPDQMNLYVTAGTVLRFSEGSIFYSTGGLFLLGRSEAPITLTAQADSWGGIVILNSAQTSEWQYAIVEKTGGVNREGWVMTGGITFYQANIYLDNTLLGNNQTEDAINVVHGKFKFTNCEFNNTLADALDSDFSLGEISNCYFHDIGGDAVDISGSTVTVSDTHLERIADKGFSVGEKSSLTVENTQMDTVGIGVASKDLSTALVTNTRISGARFAALAAYIKKNVFGPATIDARMVAIDHSEQTAVAQTGSTILIDGEAVETVDLDVELLYQEGILGN